MTHEHAGPPWPYLSQNKAAKRLGLGEEFLSGLPSHPHFQEKHRLRTFADTNDQGTPVTLYNRDDIDDLAFALNGGPQ